MFTPLPTPAEMADWDRRAIEEYGLRGEMLMENAARAACAVLSREYGPLEGARVLVLCGPGNNGGDGFAMARNLQDLGADVLALHTRPKKAYRGEARHHLYLARRCGVQTILATRFDGESSPFGAPDIIVDALLGTGFSGQLRDDMHELVHAANHCDAFLFAVDCPTGLNALTGEPSPEAVRAHATATFHAHKLGLALPSAREFTGRITVCEIGIPSFISQNHPPEHFLVDNDVLALVPRPQENMHKGTAGRVLIVGGSRGLMGAPNLSARAAFRAGAGLVTLACPAGLEPLARMNMPEIMTRPLGLNEDSFHAGMLDELLPRLAQYDAVVVGPGMGREKNGEHFLKSLLPVLSQPCVLDADALFHLANMPELTPKNAVLTPHPGEMATLLGKTVDEIAADRFGAARTLASNTGAACLLKGAGTVVASPEGRTWLVPISAPCLACGGSGDVLSGLVAALLARQVAPLPAACIGVYWHGITGKSLEDEYPGRGNLASEIADALPRTLKEYLCAPLKTS